MKPLTGLRAAIEATGWSLERVAAEIEKQHGIRVTRQTVFNWQRCHSEPRGWSLLALADVLGTTPMALYEEGRDGAE